MTAHIAGLPMYDWPEVAADLDHLWAHVVAVAADRDVDLPAALTRTDDLPSLWRDPTMIVGQVCSLNPVRDGLGETEVLGTIVYEPPAGLPSGDPGSYYSVIVCRADDGRGNDPTLRSFRDATLVANGTDSQSGYWSLGHFVRDEVVDGPLFGPARFSGAHRDSIRALVDGRADVAAIDVHSWRLALDHEPAATDRLAVIGTTAPTPGVVCVVAWELADRRPTLNRVLQEAIDDLVGSPIAERLHITGYRVRRLEEFQVVADQVEAAARRPWHRP